MALRISSELSLVIFEDEKEQDPVYGSRQRDDEIIITNMDNESSGRIDIPASGTFDVPFGAIADTRAVALILDDAATVQLNGQAPSFPITPSVANAKARFFWEGTISQVRVTNPSTTARLTGYFIAWGDIAPATP